MNKELVKLTDVSKTFNISYLGGDDFFSAVFARKHNENKLIHALSNINFTLNSGEITGIIGANGAGKSTLLKLISRILKPSSGKVDVKGNITPLLSLDAGFQDELSGEENLYLYGRAIGWPENNIKEIASEVFDYAGIRDEHRDLSFRYYSTGMKSRLIFSATTRFDPDILLIDEVLTVGDIDFQEKSFHKLRQLLDRSSGVLIISHALTQLKRVCNKLLLMDSGRIVKYGDFDEVMDYLEEISRKNNNLRISYDVFREGKELFTDSLSSAIEETKSLIPESALPPFQFDFNFHLREEFSLVSSILPFTGHVIRINDRNIEFGTSLLELPEELKGMIPAGSELSALKIKNTPVSYSYMMKSLGVFCPLRSIITYPVKGDRLNQKEGNSRSTLPQHRICLEYDFDRERNSKSAILLYRYFSEKISLEDLNTIEFYMLNPSNNMEIILSLGDENGNEIYSQAKNIIAGEYDKRIIFYLKGGFIPQDKVENIIKNVKCLKITVYPEKNMKDSFEISLPEFMGFDPEGKIVKDMEISGNTIASKLNTIKIELDINEEIKDDGSEKFNIALGHYSSEEYELALKELREILGIVENSEIHAYISRILESLGQKDAAMMHGLHSLHVYNMGRGSFFRDRYDFLRKELKNMNKISSLVSIENYFGDEDE